MSIRRIKRKIIKFFFAEQWSILICDRHNHILASIVPEKNRIWADPFPVIYNDHFYIFIEEQIKNRNGILGYIEIFKDMSYSEFKIILEKDYHLSWPNVFRIGSDWYMIPETHEHNSVDLYIAAEFPDKWKYHSTLLADTEAVDTMLFYYQEKYWLFTSISEYQRYSNTHIAAEGSNLNDNLCVFWSDTFPSSDWHPLPGNPIVTGLEHSRMAGSFYMDNKTGEIFRPAQNSLKEYGAQVIVNKLTKLSVDGYAEEKQTVIFPEKKSHAVCTHTYNFCGEYLVRDIKTRRLKVFN